LHVVASSNGYISNTFSNTSNGASAVNRIQIGNDASDGAGQLVVYGSQHSTLPNVFDITNATNNPLRFLTNNTERVRITGAGNVGIGTTSPSSTLSLGGNMDFKQSSNLTTTTGYLNIAPSSTLILDTGATIDFRISGSEKAKIDSSGRLLVGTSSARDLGSGGTHQFQVEGVSTAGSSASLTCNTASEFAAYLTFAKSRAGTIGSNAVVLSGDYLGHIQFNGADGTDIQTTGARISAVVDGAASGNDLPTRLEFSTTSDGAAVPTERVRITSAGSCIINGTIGYGNITAPGGVNYPVGSTNSSLFTGGGQGNPGYSWAFSAFPGTGASDSSVACAGGHFVGSNGISNVGGGAVGVYAKGGTGTVYGYPGAGIYAEGGNSYGVSTSGNYGIFARTYQFNVVGIDRRGNDGVLIDLIQDGTTEGTISVSGTTVSYNGAHLSRWSQLPGGTEREEILRGTVLSNLDEMCEWGDEENEQLNRMKVSDVEGDKNVSGVFQAWDDDDDTYTNDFYCAMTGDFIIRIAEGVTVERGDLLMSAGDGTAKPQDDDIIRSKTIAKVTSTNVSCTYEDGSYCVPCVLMAC
jgi:hypothetical protein